MRVEIEVVPDGAAEAAEYWLYFAVSAAPSGAASARLSRSRSTRHALAEWSTPQGREWTFRVDRIRLRLDAMYPGRKPIQLHLVGDGDPTSEINVRYRPSD